MIDKERLEEIIHKEAYLEGTNNLVMAINTDDYKWLIEQVERVQELEEHIEYLYDNNVHLKGDYRLQEQNKRYREALGFYADEDNYRVTWDDDYEPILRDGGEKARKALEGEK